jgi:D-amino-acid dehydrogenase
MTRRVLIVGDGVVALSVAYYCSQRGCDVTLVERGPRDHEGCSRANAGMVMSSHFAPFGQPGAVRLGLRALGLRESAVREPRLSGELLGWGWTFRRAPTRGRVDRAAP